MPSGVVVVRFLRALAWSLAMAATTPLWVLLAALEVVARPVRWLSRACVWVVRPVCIRFMLSVHAMSSLLPPSVHGEAGARFLAKARKARRS